LDTTGNYKYISCPREAGKDIGVNLQGTVLMGSLQSDKNCGPILFGIQSAESRNKIWARSTHLGKE